MTACSGGGGGTGEPGDTGGAGDASGPGDQSTTDSGGGGDLPGAPDAPDGGEAPDLPPGDGGTGFDYTGSVEIPAQEPVNVSSTAACALDSDCAAGLFCFQGGCARECTDDGDCTGGGSCTERGRCVGGTSAKAARAGKGGAAAGHPKFGDPIGNIDVEPGIALVLVPERIQEVAAGVEKLELAVTVTPASDEGALTYRIERTDGQGDAALVRRATGTTEFTLEVETGAANPESTDPKLVDVYVITSAGAFRLNLIPRVPFGGSYAGTALIDQFGQTGLPIDFQIVTEPADAALSEATAAWLVLPVGPDKVFSPHEKLEAENPHEFMTRPLEEDAFTGRWVATFVNEYRLGAESVLAAGAIPGQVRRTLRFELEPLGTRGLIGALSDRWTGLYDKRPDFGEPEPANVTFEGTLDMTRIGAAPEASAVTPPQDLGDAHPQPLPAPAIDACLDEHLAVEPIDGYACDDLATLTDFIAADSAVRTACAIAVARQSLESQTTARQIAAFLEGSDPGGESFADFMERCAAGTDGTCRPSPAVLCARQLAAYAFYALAGQDEGAADLVAAYQDTTREAFLGRQLGAFQADAQTRLEWLRTTDYPAIVTSAVKDLVARLLSDWSTNVLDVHLEVVAGQLDSAGLAVLSQGAAGADALAARKQLLLEMSQSWRGAAEALTLATTRWNELFQDDASRADKTAFVSRRMFDLYLSAGILTNLNRDSGASFASGAFAAGFAQLMSKLGDLRQPFDALSYARDAEVVVSTSVDPESDNQTLLREREDDARAEVAAAATAVQAILAEAQAEALQREELTNRMTNQINELRSELVELCGLPVGCTSESFITDPSCEVRVAPGACGFLIQHETDDYLALDAGAQSVSEGGRRLLAVREAMLAVERAEEELRAHNARVNLQYETTEAFAAQVQAWHAMRTELLANMNAAIQARQQGRVEELDDFLANIEARNEQRQGNFEGWAADLEKWNEIRLDGVRTDFRQIIAANALHATAGAFRDAADAAQTLAQALQTGMPTAVGTSTDPSFAARLVVMISGFVASTGFRAYASAADIAATGLETNVAKQQALREAELTYFEQAADLGGAMSDAEVDRLAELAEYARQQGAAEDQALRELLRMMENAAEAELASQRDIVELADRQHALKEMLVDAAGLEIELRQADLGVEAALQAYLQVAQRAELRAARVRELERQRAEVNALIGSPAAVFAWANRLEQAERRLIRAKAKLMDWLVALEYLAVRPFIDLRLQILLARNTYQLEALAEEIDRLQGRCGGPTSRHVADLSVRDDLLRLTVAQLDPVTGAVSSPAERFRQLLQRGYVPIDKRVRYTTDSSIGTLLSSRSVLAATFDLSLDDFANLAASCNAKAVSIAVQLVGEGLGQGQPTVSILYDGSSQLRSCQPGIEAYLDAIGRANTAYGAVTRLHTPGRSVSPVAGINAFPDSGAGNLSLAGLPLASQYTVLIDPQLGDNRAIDWNRLDDIRIRIEYSYQDLFPEGQCQ